VRRRPVDTIELTLHALALLMVVPAARTIDGLEAALVDVVASLPSVVEPIAALGYDLLAVSAVVVVALAALRRHGRLASSLVTAVPSSVAMR
jgi:hypothetical protein